MARKENASYEKTGQRSASQSSILAPRILNSEDLNNYHGLEYVGLYYAIGSNTVTNKPPGVNAFHLEVNRSADGYYYQLVIPGDNLTNTLWMRTWKNTSWTSWDKVGGAADSAMSGASTNPVQNKVVKQYIDNIGNRIVNVEKKIVADWVAAGTRVENVYVGYGHSMLLGNTAGFVLMMLSNSLGVFQIYGDSSVKNAVNIQRTGTNAVSFTTTTDFNYVTMLSLKRN